MTRQAGARQTDPEEYFGNAVAHGWALESHRETFMRAVALGTLFAEAVSDPQWPYLLPEETGRREVLGGKAEDQEGGIS